MFSVSVHQNDVSGFLAFGWRCPLFLSKMSTIAVNSTTTHCNSRLKSGYQHVVMPTVCSGHWAAAFQSQWVLGTFTCALTYIRPHPHKISSYRLQANAECKWGIYCTVGVFVTEILHWCVVITEYRQSYSVLAPKNKTIMAVFGICGYFWSEVQLTCHNFGGGLVLPTLFWSVYHSFSWRLI